MGKLNRTHLSKMGFIIVYIYSEMLSLHNIDVPRESISRWDIKELNITENEIKLPFSEIVTAIMKKY